MVLQEKKVKTKDVLEKLYGPSGKKKVKSWKMSSKSVTVLLEKSKKLKNVLEKRYNRIRNNPD